jgi:hypothetical protein
VIRLTKHAEEAIEQRCIQPTWLEAAVLSPDWTSPDLRHPDRTRYFKSIPEFGGRILRVVPARTEEHGVDPH